MPKFISDLHLHSKYSRAVSQEMNIPALSKWGKIKGIQLLGTGDWTHPLWFRELQSNLKETGNGLYKYGETYFILSCEVSSIYSQGGKVRRIHNVVFAPSLSDVQKINTELAKRGNLMSDGRPILGIPASELAEIIFTQSKDAFIIPAHIWTPWFSLYGSNSGFDSIDECFGKSASKITAIETGLSSNPAMNWRIKELDSRAIVSFSDAHSPAKVGREATVFNTELSFQGLKKAISDPTTKGGLIGTIEFYPEEGKYHYSGHRACQVRLSPEETEKRGSTCPVCGKPLTIGVMHRVEELASRPQDYKPQDRPPFKMIVPLMEIIAEALSSTTASEKVMREFMNLTNNLSSEFNVLLTAKIEDIEKVSNPKIAEGVKKVREGNIVVDPGYDGVFGIVKIWGNEEKIVPPNEQMTLF